MENDVSAKNKTKRQTGETTNGASLVVHGRRWRRSDPRIQPSLRAELVRELMAARRAVRDAANERARSADRHAA